MKILIFSAPNVVNASVKIKRFTYRMSVFSAAFSFSPDSPASNAISFTINHNSIAVKSVILCKAAPTRDAFEDVKGSWLHFS